MPRSRTPAFLPPTALKETPEAHDTITREEARRILDQYAQTRLTQIAMGADDIGSPLILLGDHENRFRHLGTIKDPEDARSAYHVARAVHEAVLALDATCVTVCMFAYKVIQGIKYHGFMLYYVDDEGRTHTRLLDPHKWNHWILDDSKYWKPFPYTFGEGPHDMPAILGRHEEPTDTADFDELLRP